jgi:hypothetical protein
MFCSKCGFGFCVVGCSSIVCLCYRLLVDGLSCSYMSRTYEANKESEERCFVILEFTEGIFYFLFFSYFELYIRKSEKILEGERKVC